MRVAKFENWLVQRGLAKSTIQNRISNCRNIEKTYPDLDLQFKKDNGNSMLQLLTYSTADQRLNYPPRHSIRINGDIRTGSATLKKAVKLYMQFCQFENEYGSISIQMAKDFDVINNANDYTDDEKIVLIQFRVSMGDKYDL